MLRDAAFKSRLARFEHSSMPIWGKPQIDAAPQHEDFRGAFPKVVSTSVMPALVAGIHDFPRATQEKRGWPGQARP
jgi:hypothetical protein